MPSAPQRRQRPKPPQPLVPVVERRQTSSERGYTWTWAKLAEQERKSRTFCELCQAAFNVETACGSQVKLPSGRMKSEGVIDHIIPPRSDEDHLFFEPENWWLLCDVPKPSNGFRPCNSWKSLHFDGTYGKAKKYASDRTLAGIAARKREVIAAMRKSAENSRCDKPPPHDQS